MFLIYFLDFPTYMFDSEHKYAIDYGTLIALSDACSAPYFSLVLYWATIAWRFMSYSDPSSCLIGFVF